MVKSEAEKGGGGVREEEESGLVTETVLGWGGITKARKHRKGVRK